MIGNLRVKKSSLWLLMIVAALMAAYVQASDSDTLDQRITSLERISNAQSQLLQQLQQQLSDNQSDIDALRGQIQQDSYQLQQVVDRQKQILLQMDALSSKPQPRDTTSNAESNKQDKAAVTSTTDRELTTEDNEQPFAPRERGVQSEQANLEYNSAIDLILGKRKYDEAIAAFESWVKKYPDSTYQPNANYWLGQLYYNKRKNDNAAYFFATVVKNFPESPKAPGALLKVGMIMQEQKKLDKAIEIFKQVISRYPATNEAKKAADLLSKLPK